MGGPNSGTPLVHSAASLTTSCHGFFFRPIAAFHASSPYRIRKTCSPTASRSSRVWSAAIASAHRRPRHPASTFWRRISTPRQEHQVGRFLGIPEERLARRAYLRTHGQATSKIRDLDRAFGHRKVRRDFSRADRVPETTFHQRRAARGRVLQELPDLSVVHKRRDAHQKAAPGGSFLGRTFDGVPQKAGERVAKRLRREERLRGESALLSLRTP